MIYNHMDDVESQRKSLKFDLRHPKTPERMATKISMGDYIPDIYPCAKLHYDMIREFCPCTREVSYQMFTRLVFSGPSNSLAPKPLRRFWRSIRQRRRFKQGCAFWGPEKPKFYIFTPFSPKNANFWSIIDGTENFRSERALAWGLHQ